MNYRFSRSVRVRRSAEFTFAIRRGDCAADGVLVLFAVASETNSPARLGITVPKKNRQRGPEKSLETIDSRVLQDSGRSDSNGL